MTAPTPDPDAVRAAYTALFDGALDEDDLVSWYRQLTDRLAVAEAAIAAAQRQRAQVVAHLHATFGLSYRQIAERLGDLDRSRVGQLAVKGRPHVTPLVAGSVAVEAVSTSPPSPAPLLVNGKRAASGRAARRPATPRPRAGAKAAATTD